MNIVDAIIILVILAFGVFGLKRGFFREAVTTVGFILVVILSFVFKNYLSVFMYEHLPFFPFGGVLKGVTVLNIILYEVIAFLIVFLILIIVFKLVLFVSKLIEKILKLTIVLAIPSKILGCIIGLIEGFVIVFIALYVLNLPVFNWKELEGSKYKDKILTSTPILSGYVSDSVKVITKFADLKEKYDTAPNAESFNYETLDLFLEHDIITVDSVKKLKEKGKLKITNLDSLITKYGG